MKLVSVLMSVYDEPLDYVKEAVESILEQDYKFIELIVIIDDPTNKIVIKYLHEIQYKYKNVKLFANDRNRGLIFSLNEGIKLCKGYYVARMDADDRSLPSRLKKEIDFLELNHYDLVGCNYLKINSLGTVIGKTDYAGNSDQVKHRLQYINCVGHPTWLLKKSVYESLNGYRNIYSCEDYDFLIRAVLHGFKIGVLEEALVKYRINENGISQQNNIRQKIISSILQDDYRHNTVIDLNYLDDYLNSSKYKMKFKIEKKLAKIKVFVKRYLNIKRNNNDLC